MVNRRNLFPFWTVSGILNFLGQYAITIKSLLFYPHILLTLCPHLQASCYLSMEYLTDLEGTQVTFDAVAEPPFNFPAQKWTILEKLSEDSNRLTKEDVAAGFGPSDTIGKFLCRPASEGDDGRRAFLRIYQQVPIAGTETKKASIRAIQADTSPDYPELIAFRTFMKLDCDVVPRLLGYQHCQQDHDEGVPGGYITYILWEKVVGESLNLTEFWRLPFADRKAIRDKFRQVYTYDWIDYLVTRANDWANKKQEVFTLRVHAMYGWFIKKIYDKSSGQMYIYARFPCGL